MEGRCFCKGGKGKGGLRGGGEEGQKKKRRGYPITEQSLRVGRRLDGGGGAGISEGLWGHLSEKEMISKSVGRGRKKERQLGRNFSPIEEEEYENIRRNDGL